MHIYINYPPDNFLDSISEKVKDPLLPIILCVSNGEYRLTSNGVVLVRDQRACLMRISLTTEHAPWAKVLVAEHNYRQWKPTSKEINQKRYLDYMKSFWLKNCGQL